MTPDMFTLAGRTYQSRLLVGTGKYKDLEETRLAIEASGAEITDPDDENMEHGYEDVTGQIELRNEPRKKKKKPQRRDGDTRGPRPDNRPEQQRNQTGNAPREGGQPRPEHKPKENAGPDQNRRNMQNPAVEKKEGDQMSNINKNLPSDQQKQADGAQDGKLPANKKKKKFFNKNRKPKDGQG